MRKHTIGIHRVGFNGNKSAAQTMVVDGGSQMAGKLFELSGPLGLPLVHFVDAQILDRKKNLVGTKWKRTQPDVFRWKNINWFYKNIPAISSDGMVQNVKSIHILLSSTSSPACAAQGIWTRHRRSCITMSVSHAFHGKPLFLNLPLAPQLSRMFGDAGGCVWLSRCLR